MIGNRVDVKVERRMCGREGNPGRVKTLRSGEPFGETTSSEERFVAAAINLGKPSDAVSAVRLSCFLS